MKTEHGNIDKWQEGIDYEIAFWNNVYRWKGTFMGMMGWSNYGDIIRLENFDANTFLLTCRNKRVLDIGCGMSYATGNYYQEKNGTKKPVDIHYVDPLAPFFNDILKRYGKRIRRRLGGALLPDIEFGMMEYISAFYPDHNVDLAVIQNALDHSAMPVKGILETLDTLRIGGCLYLNHHPDEAETEHYKGFHKYNINEKDEKLIIWNKSERWNINEIIADFADISISRGTEKHIIAVITKRKELPQELLQHKADKKYLCRQMILNSGKGMIKRKIRYNMYNIIQFFAQSLSWQTKMRIKRLIKQTNN